MCQSLNLPQYKCHKIVGAAKILQLENTSWGAVLWLSLDGGPVELRVSSEYVAKHNPQVGGYYVVYEDGYESWSPADAFESGYTKVE